MAAWIYPLTSNITGATKVKEADDKLQAAMDDLTDWANNEGDYAVGESKEGEGATLNYDTLANMTDTDTAAVADEYGLIYNSVTSKYEAEPVYTKAQVAAAITAGDDAVLATVSNVDNTSDVDKPVSDATQTALDLKADQSTTYTKDEADTANEVLLPSGMVMAFANSTAPSTWLECNGAAVSRATYAALFTAISTVYGVGNGSTTFNLPDLRGEFIRGFDNGKGTDSGRSIGTTQADATAKNGLSGSTNTTGAHTHNVGDSTNKNNATGGSLYPYAGNGTQSSSSSGSHSHTVTISGDAETRPLNIAMMYCIKV